MIFTTTRFLEQVQRRSFQPVNQCVFSEQEMLDMATEEYSTLIYPRVIKCVEDYGVTYLDQAFVDNQNEYLFPERCFNSILREIKFGYNSRLEDPNRIEIEQIRDDSTGRPHAFYFRNNKVVVYPKPLGASGYLRQYYYIKPGHLVVTSESALITNISGLDVTVSSLPSTWQVGDLVDFVSKSRDHAYVGIDFTIDAINANVLTFLDLPDDLIVGDYIALAGQSPLVQGPYLFRSVLAQATAAAVLEYAGRPGAEEARAKANAMLDIAIDNFTPRVLGEERYLISEWL
jgi:hypothetical protein